MSTQTDSLAFAIDTAPYSDSVHQQVDTVFAGWQNDLLYGPHSERIIESIIAQPDSTIRLLTDNPIFQTILVILSLLYLFLLYRYHEPIRLFCSVVLNRKKEEKTFADPGRQFEQFLFCSILLGILSFGCTATRLLGLFVSTFEITTLPPVFRTTLSLSIALSTALVIALQCGITDAVGRLTFSTEITTHLIRLKQLFLASIGLVLTPFVLLSLNEGAGWDNFMTYLYLSIICITYFIFLYKTCVLFIQRNVSLLHWILYLCGVEIFPVSLIACILLKIA